MFFKAYKGFYSLCFKNMSFTWIKFSLIYSALTVSCYEQFEDKLTNNTDKDVSRCATNIITNLIEYLNNTIIDVTAFNMKDNIMLKDLHDIQKVRIINRSFLPPNQTSYKYICLIECRNLKELRNGIRKARNDPLWNPEAYFIIIFANTIDSNLITVFQLLMKKYIFIATVVGRFNEDTNYSVYSYNFDYTKICGICKIKNIKLISSCNDIGDMNVFLNSKHPTMNGCTLKVITHIYPPFVRDKKLHYRGLDEYLLILLSKMQGFDIEFVFASEDFHEDFGKVLKNFTYTGMLSYIEDEESEIAGACGGFVLSWSRSKALSFLYPYVVDRISLVIPRAPIFDTWSAVATQLSVFTITLTFLVFVIFSIMAIKFPVFVKSEEDKIRDVLLVWAIFFCILDLKSVKKLLVARITVMTMFIFVILMYCVIQASLLRESTRPRRAYQMDDVEEVFESNFEMILSPPMAAYLKSFTKKEQSLWREGKVTCNTTIECLKQVRDCANRSLFTVSSDIYHKSYVWELAEEDGTFEIFTVPETFSFSWQTMYFHRGFPLNKLNDDIHYILASGLLEKQFEDLNFNARKKRHFHEKPANIAKTIDDLKGVFVLLIFGWGLSIITFLIELRK